MNTSALSLTLTLALALAALGASAAPSVASLSVTPTLGASTASTANMALPQPASTDAQAAADLRLEALGMGDLVRVTVFRNPELTTEARVSERGTILFPMLGEVPISGLTPSQAGQRIADRLRAGKYVVNPEVNVSLAPSWRHAVIRMLMLFVAASAVGGAIWLNNGAPSPRRIVRQN
ncbi:MAG: polysaccharide biosynthesis/export family protein, partial [Usitatibacter sp.]